MKSLGVHTTLSDLPTEVIDAISAYLSQEDKEHVDIAFPLFFQCTRSVVYHASSIPSLGLKRKRSPRATSPRSLERATMYMTHHEKVLELLQTPTRASQLASFTLLQPYDFKAADVSRLSARKHRQTTLIEKGIELDRVLGLLSQNAPWLRRFETTISGLPVIPGSVNLTELKIPSETNLREHLPSLTSLTLVHSAMRTSHSLRIPSFPKLLYLHIQVMGATQQRPDDQRVVNLDVQPALQELVVSQQILRETRFLSTAHYTPKDFFVGDSSSLRHATLHEARFESYESFTEWLSTTAPESLLSLSFNRLHFEFDPDEPTGWSWPGLPKLRSMELHNTDPTYFRSMQYDGLRKLFISNPLRVRLRPLLKVLERVAPSIQAISLVQTESGLSESTGKYSVFSPAFVDALARCVKLRHFESVGCYFFGLKDWQYLCARVFDSLDQLHVESRHEDVSPMLRRIYSPSTHHIAPAGLKRLYDGRFFVSPKFVSRWACDIPTPTVEQSKNMYCDSSPCVTQYLCQQFRLHADAEKDLRFAGFVVDDVYNEDVGPPPAPLVEPTEAWRFPTQRCERLCCANHSRTGYT